MGDHLRTTVITFLCLINFNFRFVEQIKDAVYNLPLLGRGTTVVVDEYAFANGKLVVFDEFFIIQTAR